MENLCTICSWLNSNVLILFRRNFAVMQILWWLGCTLAYVRFQIATDTSRYPRQIAEFFGCPGTASNDNPNNPRYNIAKSSATGPPQSQRSANRRTPRQQSNKSLNPRRTVGNAPASPQRRSTVEDDKFSQRLPAQWKRSRLQLIFNEAPVLNL